MAGELLCEEEGARRDIIAVFRIRVRLSPGYMDIRIELTETT